MPLYVVERKDGVQRLVNAKSPRGAENYVVAAVIAEARRGVTVRAATALEAASLAGNGVVVEDATAMPEELPSADEVRGILRHPSLGSEEFRAEEFAQTAEPTEGQRHFLPDHPPAHWDRDEAGEKEDEI